jgi:hypothetical protein
MLRTQCAHGGSWLCRGHWLIGTLAEYLLRPWAIPRQSQSCHKLVVPLLGGLRVRSYLTQHGHSVGIVASGGERSAKIDLDVIAIGRKFQC